MFASARDLFESAREASRDMERVKRQLDAMGCRALALGSGGFEPRVSSTHDPDRMGARVAAKVDREAVLLRRYEEDRRLVDLALAVLYGTDSDAGLWALVGWPADAIYHHYLALRTWEETAALLGYSAPHVRRQVSVAFDLADANGQMWTRLGRGLAT